MKHDYRPHSNHSESGDRNLDAVWAPVSASDTCARATAPGLVAVGSEQEATRQTCHRCGRRFNMPRAAGSLGSASRALRLSRSLSVFVSLSLSLSLSFSLSLSLSLSIYLCIYKKRLCSFIAHPRSGAAGFYSKPSLKRPSHPQSIKQGF